MEDKLDCGRLLIYNLADTFFIGQTHNDILVAAVSLATPVFLIFMAIGTIFGIGGTSVISRAFGEERFEYAKKTCAFCMWSKFMMRYRKQSTMLCVPRT